MKPSILLVFAAYVLFGCSSTESLGSGNYSSAVVVDSAEMASDIAKKAVLQREPLYPIGKIRVNRTTNGWSVLVWDDPPTPGGSRIVRVEFDGRVSSIEK